MHLRESLTGTVLAALASLMLAATQFAPLIPSWEALPEVPGSHHLDYGPSYPGAFLPLTDAFIAQALGITRDRATGAPGSRSRAPGTRNGHPAVSHTSKHRTVVTHPFTNDNIEDAYPIQRLPFTARTDANGASRQQGEPAASCAPTGSTVWYAYRSPTDEGLIASTIGTPRPASLGVFTGSPDHLQEVRCASNVEGNAKTAFPAKAGTTYYFQVTTPTGGGPVVFNLDPFGRIERVSVNSRGEGGNARSLLSGISANGRWVVFGSDSSDLVDDDTNDACDVFVRDRTTDETIRVSVASDGAQADGESWAYDASITPDGRYVAFNSEASNLVHGDTNDWADAFVHDRRTGETTRVSVSSSGAQGEAPIDPAWMGLNAEEDLGLRGRCNYARGISISANGRFVAFQSPLRDLVPGDDEGYDLRPEGTFVVQRATWPGEDVFVHDRWTGETTMVSVHSDGTYGNGWSDVPTMSAGGRYVAFRSYADNLVDDDTNATSDVFVHDRRTADTARVSVHSNGEQANDRSGSPAISASGRYVAFLDWASNLVDDDSNDYLDVFVHDRKTAETTRVSVTSDGQEQKAPNDPLEQEHIGLERVSISADGRFVTFASQATNMSPGQGPRYQGPTQNYQGVFVHDRFTATTIEVSFPLSEPHPLGEPFRVRWSTRPLISADGHVVAFSSADQFNEEDTSANSDVFVHTFPVLR